MTNETSEDIPEISSGNGHVFNCCTRCGHFDIGWHKRVTFLTVFYFRVGMKWVCYFIRFPMWEKSLCQTDVSLARYCTVDSNKWEDDIVTLSKMNLG